MTATDPAVAETFGPYEANCVKIMRQLLAEKPAGSLDEHAFPAYLQGNPPSRWLFWRRIEYAFHHAALLGNDNEAGNLACMDFGCGSGLLLPRLHAFYPTVYGVDLRPEAAGAFLGKWYERETGYGKIKLLGDVMSEEIPRGTLDLILAFDVLEHISDLDPMLKRFGELLKPGGRIVVSGPTENFLYKIGRKIVGFSGDYHVHNIATIRQAMRKFYEVRILRRLYWPASLFWILEARKRG